MERSELLRDIAVEGEDLGREYAEVDSKNQQIAELENSTVAARGRLELVKQELVHKKEQLAEEQKIHYQLQVSLGYCVLNKIVEMDLMELSTQYQIMTNSRTTAQDMQMQEAHVALLEVQDKIKTQNKQMSKVDQKLVALRSEIQELRKRVEAEQQSTAKLGSCQTLL